MKLDPASRYSYAEPAAVGALGGGVDRRRHELVLRLSR